MTGMFPLLNNREWVVAQHTHRPRKARIIRWESPAWSPLRQGAQISRQLRADRNPWKRVADALRKRPGQWAVLEDTRDMERAHWARSKIDEIRNGVSTPFRPVGSFDACGRFSRDRIIVYARYTGATLAVPSRTEGTGVDSAALANQLATLRLARTGDDEAEYRTAAVRDSRGYLHEITDVETVETTAGPAVVLYFSPAILGEVERKK